MKKDKTPYPILGIAIGLLMWAAQELFLLSVTDVGIEHTWVQVLSGIILGGILGMCIAAMDGLLIRNPPLLVKGAQWGSLLGAVGGALGFFLIAEMAAQSEIMRSGGILAYLVLPQRWLIITLAIGVAMGLRDQSHLRFVRGLLASALTGIVGGFWITGIMMINLDPVVGRGLALVGFTLIYSLIYVAVIQYKRDYWLLSLNGSLEGREFELCRSMQFLGTQNEDLINLGGYQEVNSTHAKLIRYETGYSLVDNDPFCRTLVNFRNVTEQPLKNGDIIKVGTALFQYCTKE